MKKKIMMPFLLLVLALGGCKTPDGSTSNPIAEESSDIVNNDSTSTVEENKDLEALGYTKATGWPTAEIAEYLSVFNVTESVPVYEDVTELFHIRYVEESIFLKEVFEIAVLDTTNKTLTGLHNLLEANSWANSGKLEENYVQAYNSTNTIGIFGELYEGDENFPAGTYIYIVGFGTVTTTDPLLSYEKHSGWPSETITKYLADYSITDVTVVGLEVTESLTKVITDDPNFDPYLEIIVPGNDRTEEYKTLLTAGSYTLEPDAENPDYIYAKNATQNVMVEFYFGTEYNGWPQGMYIFVSALTGTYTGETGGNENPGGGTVGNPTNPESAVMFDLKVETQISGAKDAQLTTWAAGDVTMKVEKGTSTVNVGNIITNDPRQYFSNPLRIYAAQVLTFTAPTNIEQIVFTTDAAHASTIDTLTGSLTGGSFTVSGNVVTLALTTPATSYSLTAGAQFRLMEVTLYFI